MRINFQHLILLPFKKNGFAFMSFDINHLTAIYRHIFAQILISLILVVMNVSAAQSATNDDFGRLFSRPAERAKLDYLRQNQALRPVAPVANIDEDSDVEEMPVALPAPITLQGYVKRSDGSKSTLWINNQAVQEDSTIRDVHIGKLNQNSNKVDGLELNIPANGKRIRLKAGQMYEPETNQIRELKLIEKEKQLNLQDTGEINANDGEPE